MKTQNASAPACTVLDRASTRFEPMPAGASEKIANSPWEPGSATDRRACRTAARPIRTASSCRRCPYDAAHQGDDLCLRHSGRERYLSRRIEISGRKERHAALGPPVYKAKPLPTRVGRFGGELLGLTSSARDGLRSARDTSVTCLSWFHSFNENQAFSFSKRSHGFEAPGPKRALRGIGERRTLRCARQEGADTAARRSADKQQASRRTEDARHLADRRCAIVVAHPAEESARVVDDCDVEVAGIERQPGWRCDLRLQPGHRRFRRPSGLAQPTLRPAPPERRGRKDPLCRPRLPAVLRARNQSARVDRPFSHRPRRR